MPRLHVHPDGSQHHEAVSTRGRCGRIVTRMCGEPGIRDGMQAA